MRPTNDAPTESAASGIPATVVLVEDRGDLVVLAGLLTDRRRSLIDVAAVTVHARRRRVPGYALCDGEDPADA